MTSPESTTSNPTRPRLRRLFGLVILVLLLAAIAFWLYPPRRDRLATLDGQQEWSIAEAPPQRQIIWRSADVVPQPPLPKTSQPSMVRPQFSADGLTLYFSLRDPSHDLNIYQSKFQNGDWSPAEAISALNSAADDVGPALAADGSTLYFYSDREGGHGGFDLYRSLYSAEGWGKPVNLGSRINSVADECEPAITPDGKSLYFSSNHSSNMQGRRRPTVPSRQTGRWTSTLRAAVGFNQYNLYRARRQSASSAWEDAKLLIGLNRSDANDGSPCVDPSGSFLYFSSDRPQRQGERKNLDLYRARIRKLGHGDPDNLGEGINTPGHELEPFLGPHPFQIYFSRTAEKPSTVAPEEYHLYTSTAVEVEVQDGRDFSHLSALGAFFQRIIFRIGQFFQLHWWSICLMLLFAGVLAGIIWYLRRVSFQRASVPVFFVWAMVIHLVLGAGSFYIYFDDELMQNVKETFRSVLVASRLANDNLHQSHKPGQESYEKVADLKSVETVQTSEIARQITENPNIAVATDSAIPQLPSRASVTLETIPRLQVETIAKQPVKKIEPVDRQNDIPATLVEATARLEAPQDNSQQVKKLQVARTDPTLVRRSSVQPDLASDSVAPIPPTTSVTLVEPKLESLQDQSPQASDIDTKQKPLDRQQAADVDNPAALEIASVDLPPATATTAKETPLPTASLKIPRSDNALVPTPATLPTIALPAKAMVRPDATRPLERQVREPLGPETVIAQATFDTMTVLSKASPPAPTTVGQKRPAPLLANPSQETSTPFRLSRPSQQVTPTRQAPSPLSRNPGEEAAQRQTPSIPQPLNATPTTVKEDAIMPRPASPADQLARASTDTSNLAAKPIETLAIPSRDGSAPGAPPPVDLPALKLALRRLDAPPLGLPANTATDLGGPVRPSNPRLIVGSVTREKVDAPISTSPHVTALLRTPARAPEVLYAEDDIGLQALLRLRKIDLATKRELIKLFGGSEKTLDSINHGLAWIAQQQYEDGHWSLNKLRDIQGKKSTDPGNTQSDTAATGFALLPLLGNGNTHQEGPYKDHVQRGLQWLIKQQQSNGELSNPKPHNSRMYSHGVAAIALCEAYAMSQDASLKDPAQRAINFIVAAQHKQLGGWRYNPGDSPDTSVVGWQVMALKSGHMANLNVPEATLLGARKWLDHVSGKGNKLGQFGYTNSGNLKPEMTAEALLCLQYLDVSQDDPQLQAGAAYMLKTLPAKGKQSSYYWYYGSQFMYHMQGDPWKKWNDAMKPLLLQAQVTKGHEAGTWKPRDNWEKSGGRLLSTSLRILVLEVYFRHLPLYQMTEP